MVEIDFKLVRKKSVEGFWRYSLFRKKTKQLLILYHISNVFNYTYNKLFIKDAKNNREIFPNEKRGSKT